MRLLIMGQPGAGKGTQAALIKNFFGIEHISTGDMFREAISGKTKLGLEAQGYIAKGELVPDSLTMKLVEERLGRGDLNAKGFLLDGFPRNVKQAEFLDGLLLRLHLELDLVININVNEEILVSRITGRRVCSNCQSVYHIETLKPKTENVCDKCQGKLIQRKDDEETIIRNRLKVYRENTYPLLKFYEDKKLLKTFDGSKDVDSVFKDIKDALRGLQ